MSGAVARPQLAALQCFQYARAVLGLNGFPLDEMNLGALVSMLVTKAFVFQFEFVGL